MELLYLFIAWLPVISSVVGVALLIIGFVKQKNTSQASKGFMIAGTCCIGICIVVYLAFFMVGALGIGPIPV